MRIFPLKKNLFRIFILLLLTPAIFLQGCFPTSSPQTETTAIEGYHYIEEYDLPELPAPVRPPRPGRFTLRYDPNSTVNPLTSLNRDNIVLSSLLYESLFVLDAQLIPHPLLAANWSSDDNVVFTIEIRPDVMMHDNANLTANDVAYSIRQATRSGRFVNRLNSITRIEATSELEVTIVLNAPNSRFTHLLDIPIIRNGTSGNRLPPGSGPYRFSEFVQMRLEPFPLHRYHYDLPVSIIHLRDCLDTELTELFDTGGLSLLWDDPASSFEIRLNRLREARYFETTTLQFIGFNTNHTALRDPDIRRAIGVSINRQYITENIMPPGLTLAAPVALSPAFQFYDEQWGYSHLPPLEEMGRLMERAGLYDFTQNLFLDLSDGRGGYTAFSIDFIVNIENTHKVLAAHQITERLRRNGLDVVVRELPWDRFVTALETGNFDMFYGEVQLGADFDLSPLLLPGPLNFGRSASNEFRPFIYDFLRAQTESEIRWASERLVNEISINAPFAPILYKRHVIYTPIGAVTGATPSQSSVFRNFSDWTINLMMLT